MIHGPRLLALITPADMIAIFVRVVFLRKYGHPSETAYFV